MIPEYVQLLVVSPRTALNPQGRVLLCKWLSGDFAGRYTGIWGKFVPELDIDHEAALWRHAGCPEVPGGRRHLFDKVQPEVVAKFKFDVPEENWEYIYLAKPTEEDAAKDDFVNLTGGGLFECQWFDQDKIPFDEMPADDAIWYPRVLDGKKCTGEFKFAGEPKYSIKFYEIVEVNNISPCWGKSRLSEHVQS